jgi:hypothetical protein
MLQEPPTAPQPQPPVQVPNPLQPQTIETIQPPSTPPQSTVPIDPDYDNHVAEFLTVTIWINSKKGQNAKVNQPAGFMNVRLHGLAHKAQIMKSMQPPPGPSMPPPPGAHPPGPATAPHHEAPAAGAPGHVPPSAPPAIPPPTGV